MNLKEFTQTRELTPRAQRQLRGVYQTLGSTVAMAAVGFRVADRWGLTYLVMDYMVLIALGLMALMAAIHWIPARRDTVARRTGLLWAFGGLTGMMLEPVVSMNEMGLVYMAMGGAASLFGGFTVATMTSTRRAVVYGVGTGVSVLGMMGWVMLIGWLYPSTMGYSLVMLMGLLSSCLGVVAGTQQMLDEAQNGDLDPVVHALSFFNLLVSLFVRLMRLLSDDRQRRDSRRRQKSSRPLRDL